MGGLLIVVLVIGGIALAIFLYVLFLKYIALPGALIVGLVGAAFGAAAALHEFTRSMWYRARNRGADVARPGQDEPAFRSYMAGPVLRDLRLSLLYSARALRQWVALALGLAGTVFRNKWTALFGWPLAIAGGVGAVAGALGGLAMLVLLTLVSSLTILPLVGVALMVGRGVQGIEAVQQRLRHAHYRCSTCHAAFDHPVYRCPGCGREHRDLLPGMYGIFRRRCACDQVLLPTLRSNGRGELPAFCPQLDPLPRSMGRLEDVHIPIAGGPHSGKTTLLAAAFAQLASLSRDDLTVELEGADGKAFARIVDELGAGNTPDKTISQHQPALLARVSLASGGRRRRDRFLFAYDVAGELYSDADRVRASQSLNAIRGAVLVVEPESLPSFRIRRGSATTSDSDAVPLETPSAVYARLVNVLKERGADLKKVAFTVVVTKTDSLEDDQPDLGSDSGGAVRDWLTRSGESNLVGLVEQDFATVEWFGCSALGREPDASGRPFEPQGALAPFAWLLERNGIKLPRALDGPVDRAAVTRALRTTSDHAVANVVEGHRARGARRSRVIRREPMPAPELKSMNLLAHVPWALAVGALGWGVWSSGVLRTSHVGEFTQVALAAPIAHHGRAPGAQRVFVSHGRSGALGAARFPILGGWRGILTITRGRRLGGPVLLVVHWLDARGSHELRVRVGSHRRTLSLGPGRYSMRGIGSSHWRIVLTVRRS